MTIPSYRAVEPLYIVMLRNSAQAENLFREWIKQNRIEHAHASGHKMMLHDQGSFDRFRMTWNNGFESVTVWDNWNRRHIYFD